MSAITHTCPNCQCGNSETTEFCWNCGKNAIGLTRDEAQIAALTRELEAARTERDAQKCIGDELTKIVLRHKAERDAARAEAATLRALCWTPSPMQYAEWKAAIPIT